MSEWKTSGSEVKKLHTGSNLKTSTSFEFAQSSHFEFMASHPPMLPHEDEIPEFPSIVRFAQANNNSTISLQQTVSQSATRELIAMMEMVNFFSQQTLQKYRWISCKREMVIRLSELVANTQENIKSGRLHYEKRRQCLEKRRAKVMDFKKRKLRAVTEQTQEIEMEISCMLKGLKPKNVSRSFIDHRNEESSIRDTQHTKRKRIYVPITPPIYNYPQQYLHYANASHQPVVYSQTQYPVFLNPHNKIDPSCRSSVNFKNRSLAQQGQTAQKEPIVMEHLRKALTLKFNNPEVLVEQTENNIDYFDRQNETPSKSRQQAGRRSQTPKSVIRRSSSIKWKKDDNQDKQLVDIIEKSIKYIKTENSQQQPQNTQAPSVTAEELQRMSPIRPIRNNNNSDSSSINITYDSEDKRNSKSFDREGDSNDRRRLSSKASDKKIDRGRIQQSSIKIEMIDMSNSKNSGSSHSDSSKQHPNRYMPSLAKPFQQIAQEPQEMVSLKASPNYHNLKNSSEKQLRRGSKISNKPDSQKNPSSPLFKQQQQDQILKSIKLDTESRISRGNFRQSQTFSLQQRGDDILDGITLLKESRASRQKALSLKSSSLQQFMCDEQESEKEKGSQSQVFAKEIGELDPAQFFDSSLRLSTKSKIANPGRQRSFLIKGGKTQPVKGQLTSIPSAELEQQDEETPPQSKNRIKTSSNR